jgi:hypothetical protein
VERQSGFSRHPAVHAFCSYVHKDNESFGSAIEHLVEDLRAFHEAETGRSLHIFFDRSDIGWGQDLRKAISDSVENATFFIPMLTARYFQSPYCRDELLSFYGKCKSLGVTDLILPVVLAGGSQIREDSEDELVRIIARINYMDWADVWPSGRGSPAWSIGIARLVRRLVDLEERIEGQLARTLAESAREAAGWVDGPPAEDDSDLPENANSATDYGRTALKEVRTVVERLGAVLTSFGDDFSKELGDASVADDYQIRAALDRLAASYASRGYTLAREARAVLEDLVEYDARQRAAFRAGRQIGNPQAVSYVAQQVAKLREAAIGISEMIRRVDTMSDSLSRYSEMSVSLRVALSPIRAAIQSLRDIARILDGWLAIDY